MDPTNIHGDCSFAKDLLQGSYLSGKGKIDCSRSGTTLDKLELSDVATLLQRCGRQLSDFNDFDYNICDNHKKLLLDTFQFADRYRQYCLWPDHPKGARNAKDLQTAELQDVLDFKKYEGKLIPYGGKICMSCRKNKTNKLRAKINSQKESLDAQYAELRNQSFEENEDVGPSPARSASSDASWQLDLKNKLQEMRLHLNRLNILNRIKEVKIKDTLSKKIESVSERRQLEIMRNAGASIASVLHTVYAFKREDDTFDDGNLWKMIKESKVVDNFLDNAPPISSLLTEIIKSCNSSADPRLRIQILSLIVNEVPYSFIANNCNPTWYKDKSSVSREEKEDEEAEAEAKEEVKNMDPEEANKLLVLDIQIPDDLKFTFPVTRHMWRRAKVHYKQHKHALAPVPKTKITRWHWDLETVRAVVDFVSDPLNTQQVAYGTLRTRDETGKLTHVARVIRLHQKSVLVGLIQKYLKEVRQFQKIPSRSSIYRLLSRMPSVNMKAMKGIDTTQELAMRSFDKLQEILDQIKGSEKGLDEAIYKNFKDCINSSKLYLKTSYGRNLSMHSEIASHCVGFACSDPSNPEYKNTCPGSHTQRCEHCDNIRDLFRAFRGLLHMKKSSFKEPIDFVEAEYEVNLANERVWEHQCHIVRTWIQSFEWSDMLTKMDPGIALVTSDWAMKYEPLLFREMQVEWYGKKGILSNKLTLSIDNK